MQLNEELLEQIKQAKNPEELLTLAKNNGYQMTEEEAKEYFNQLNKNGELSDDELDSVAGGGCGGETKKVKQTDESDYCVHFEKDNPSFTGTPCCGQCRHFGPALINNGGNATVISACHR